MIFKLSFLSLVVASLAQAKNVCKPGNSQGPQGEGLTVVAGNSYDEHDLGYNLPFNFNDTTGAMFSQPWIRGEQGVTDTPYSFTFFQCTSRYATKLAKTATPYTFGKLLRDYEGYYASESITADKECLTYKKHKNVFVLEKCSLTDDVTSNHQTFATKNTQYAGETFYAGTGSKLNSQYGVTGYQYKAVPNPDGTFTITLDFQDGVTEANSFGTYFTD